MIILDKYEQELLAISHQIIAYLIKSGVKPSQAQDVVQDVFVQILELNLSLPLEKMRAWMYRTAIRRYIDSYRRDKHYYDILQKEFFTKDTLNTYDSDNYDDLYEAICRLKKKQQYLLDLYYFQNFSIKEISHITGQSQSAIKIQLMRSRKVLKKILEKKGIYDDPQKLQ
ncbi:RNA polymerase sigma factor [Streptococcus hongkongensis]